MDVGGPEGGEGAVGDGGGEGGGTAAELAGGVAVGDVGPAVEDVRAADDLEPEAAAGALAGWVRAGGEVGV